MDPFFWIVLLGAAIAVIVKARRAGSGTPHKRAVAPTAAGKRPTTPVRVPSLKPPAPSIEQPAAPNTMNDGVLHIDRSMSARWVPFGTDLLWGSATIKGGGFYAGVARSNSERHASLLEPALPYDYRNPDWSGSTMPYWPQYASIQPRARGAFISFLNSARDGRVGIGLVFLYFYGLERRLLKDAIEDADARREVPIILAELDRLRRIYGENGSFRGYSNALIATARAIFAPSDAPVAPPDPPPPDLDSLTNYGLGRIVAEGRALPADWALAWARASAPEARSSMWDCVWPEVRRMFEQRYRMTFPGGLVVPAPKSRLRLEYRWAAIAAGGPTSFDLEVPDLSRSHAKPRLLARLLVAVLNELEPLRRVRRSKARTPLAELAAMPAELRGGSVPPELAGIERRIRAELAQQSTLPIATLELARGFGLATDGKLTKRDATLLATALESLGAGVEPDVRFGASTPRLDGTSILFALPAGAARAPTAAFSAALLLIQAALLVAGDDGSNQAEIDAVIRSVEDQFELSASERARIDAHIDLLRCDPPKSRSVETAVRALPAPDREAFARTLVDIAAADGMISPGEIRLLERFYKALQLDPGRVHGDLHRAATGQRPIGRGPGGHALDEAAIAAKLAETARVQAALSQIFVEEPAVPSPPRATTAVDVAAVAGLDADHTKLLERIVQLDVGELARADFDAWCEALSLMPDGALETLNELAFEHADEPLAEDGDPLEINPAARDALRALFDAARTPAPA